MIILALLTAAIVVPSMRQADPRPIEAVEYADSAAAARAWQPQYGSESVALSAEKTPDGGAALRLPCDMSKLQERACWDRAVSLDLSQESRLRFWIKATGDIAALASCTLYLNAGDGWYGQNFDIPDDGWHLVTLDRGSFTPEGNPDGWGKIRAIRLSFWKAMDRSAAVFFGGMVAESASVAVVRCTRGGKEVESWPDRMTTMLRAAGIDAGTVDDVDVEQGVLRGKKIAVYPMNPAVSEAEAAELQRFVDAGGRILACYIIPERLGRLLGVESTGWLGNDPAGRFSAMRFVGDAPDGLPRIARQSSWNITTARAAGRNARVIADWIDASGKPSGAPAVLLSDTGAFISHVVLDDDRPAKLQMLRALCGSFDPGVWASIARDALRNSRTLSGRWDDIDQTIAGISAMAARAATQAEVAPLLQSAKQACATADDAVRKGRYREALEPAALAEQRLTEAFARAQSSRPGEFRAFWCHSAYGVEGMTWDQAVANLKRHGFTAIMPNMLWGGSADYPSALLPVSERSRKEGDAIKTCLAACRKYGLEVHVWKVNWNLGNAPADFVERMRREGRLQRTNGGVEEAWLCPSHPANFALERDSMLEVVRTYPVDGIHFDYIRYPDSAKCYCDGCRERFVGLLASRSDRPFTGLNDWPRDVLRGGPLYADYQEFRRSNINRLVKAVAEEARRIRPSVRISAAVFPNWPACREEIGQDWGLWVREGWLDFVCPMDYTASNREFRTRVQIQKAEVAGRIPLYPGIGASAPGLSPIQVLEQIGIVRDEGAPGFIIFNYDPTTASEHVAMLSLGATKE